MPNDVDVIRLFRNLVNISWIPGIHIIYDAYYVYIYIYMHISITSLLHYVTWYLARSLLLQ